MLNKSTKGYVSDKIFTAPWLSWPSLMGLIVAVIITVTTIGPSPSPSLPPSSDIHAPTVYHLKNVAKKKENEFFVDTE
jgi:hypothetical protein